MTINNNSVEQINVALLDMDKKLKSTASKSASASDFKNLEASVDNIKRTLNETKTGLEPGKTYNINISGNAATADKAKEAEKANKLVNALTVNGKTYDGSEAVDAGVQTVANGGTGATDAAGGFNALADGVRDSSPPEDDNKMLFKPSGTWYKTTCLDFWNYIKGKISSVLGLTKDNYGGKSAKSSFLDEYVGAGGTRPTSGNIVPKDASEYGGMRKDVVTSSMTDSGRPGQDGHLLTMFWDNNGRWDNQVFVSNEKQPLEVKVRAKANEADYGPWVDLITSQNIGSQTVARASTAGTADVANALSDRGYITNTDTFQDVMNNDGKWVIEDLSPGWHGSLYSFHAGSSQSGLMFRIRGSSTDIRNVEVNYSIDSNRFAGPWVPLIGRIPTSAPSSPKDGDIWIE